MINSNDFQDDGEMKDKHSLINDSDFVSLMEAEYDAKKKPDIEISKRRIWKSIQTTIDSHKNEPSVYKKTRHFYSIAAMLLVIAVTLPVFFSSNKLDITDNGTDRTKGVDDIISTNLTVYTLDKSGKLVNSSGRHNVGTTLLFKVLSSQIGVASIIASRNGILSNNGLIYKITQDKLGQLLSQQEQVYGYMVEPTDKILQFCIVAASSIPQLQANLSLLDKTWARLDANACSTINVTGSLEQ